MASVRDGSTREFDKSGIALAALETTLEATRPAGGRYPYASAGGFYATETYVLSRSVEGLAESLVCHYLPEEHSLELLWVADSMVSSMFTAQDWMLGAAAVLVVSADLRPYEAKYSERGYRFALLEAGAVAHILCAAATSAGLSTCIVGGFPDEALNRLLGLTEAASERSVCCIALGNRRPLRS